MKENSKENWAFMRATLASTGLTQPQIALECGVSQAAVSRLLARCPDRAGSAFRKLFTYATIRAQQTGTTSPARIKDASLVSAIQEVWNGTPEHALALAAMIRAVGTATRIAMTDT